ncbi:MAG TPA: hypothetical protein VKG24_02970 [Pseudolabrys sp.]|nr:hypothetical protein [Pseudolabrys sp.]
MDYNLEYGLRFVHRVGKRWAVQEVDANGRQIGGDHFDWAWPLDFTVTSCALSDYIEIKTELQTEDPRPRSSRPFLRNCDGGQAQ